MLLPLIPLIKKEIIDTKNIIIDSKSGYSGAGRSIHKKFENKNLYDSLSVYGIAVHRHNSEIQQELNMFTKKNVNFTFTPHLSPMFRGILSTIYVNLKKRRNAKTIAQYLNKYYKNKKFIQIAKPNTMISTNDVINSNNCKISVCDSKTKNQIILLSVIDNLIKGGAGQAVQNMNLKFNISENQGL